MSNPLNSLDESPPAAFTLLPVAERRAWVTYAADLWLRDMPRRKLPAWKLEEQRQVMVERIGMLLEKGMDAAQIERYFLDTNSDDSRRGR